MPRQAGVQKPWSKTALSSPLRDDPYSLASLEVVGEHPPVLGAAKQHAPGSSVFSSGRFRSEWTSRTLPARKAERCLNATSISARLHSSVATDQSSATAPRGNESPSDSHSRQRRRPGALSRSFGHSIESKTRWPGAQPPGLAAQTRACVRPPSGSSKSGD